MIGKPEWFKYRIFGWGVAPKTWQGYVYMAIWAFLLAGSFAVTINTGFEMWIFGALIVALLVDVAHIMTQMSKVTDERENHHQLIVERNCSFAAIVALLGVAVYQTYEKRELIAQGLTGLTFDWSLLVVLGAMLLTKIISTAYVRTKM